MTSPLDQLAQYRASIDNLDGILLHTLVECSLSSGDPCEGRDPSLDDASEVAGTDGIRAGHLPAQVSAEIEFEGKK